MNGYWGNGMTFLWIALIALLASMLQSSTGFGFAIVSMALWPLIIPMKSASIVTAIVAFLMVLYISAKLWKHINFRQLIYPTLASTAAGIAGVFLFMVSAESLLKRILGAILFLMSVYAVFFSEKIKFRPTPARGLFAGALSGFMGGLLNIGGPPMVAYYLSVCDDKLEYTATMQAFFALSSISVLGTHIAMGNFSEKVVWYCIPALIGLAAGTVIGLYFLKKLPFKWIKRSVYLLMAAFGLFLLFFE